MGFISGRESEHPDYQSNGDKVRGREGRQVMNPGWFMSYLQDEITEFFLSDPELGQKLSADALRCGGTSRPMDLATFALIAPSLKITEGLLCFHVERSYAQMPEGDYTGPMMFVFRPETLTRKMMRRLRIEDQQMLTLDEVLRTVN